MTRAWEIPGTRGRPLRSRRREAGRNGAAASIAAGALAGLVGTLAMGTFEAAWSRLLPAGMGPDEAERQRLRRRAGVGRGRHAQGEPRAHYRAGPTPTERAAEAIYRRATGRRPSDRQREVGGSILHYLFGAGTGAVYGALSASPRLRPLVTSGHGVLYATLVWLLADEVAMPAAGIAPGPARTPPRAHALSLGEHVAFGLALEQGRRLLTKAFGR